MGIDGFAESVKDGVQEQLGDGYQVTVCETDKNNGVVYTGLKVSKEDSDISPLIYLNNHFKEYENGDITLPEVADYVASTSKKKNLGVDMRQFLNYERIKGCIVYKLVNTERNRELLEDIPHMEYIDLSIVFQCVMAGETGEIASILIHNVHMKLWDITVEDLFKAAEENTLRLMGCKLMSMGDVICEIMQAESPENFDCDAYRSEFKDFVPMYVLSNKYRIEGAACILYTGLLSVICDQLESSFYIIPSSIHETLILPIDNTDENEEIRDMIKEVNDTQVSAEDILSYSLYFYDRKEHRLYIVE